VLVVDQGLILDGQHALESLAPEFGQWLGGMVHGFALRRCSGCVLL
jgi:hypothetical protein